MSEISIPLFTGLALIGLSSGFLGGMLGIGGGVVIVPGLILLFESTGAYPADQVTLVAVATSLACIVFTSLSAAYTQYRASMVRWDLFRKLVVVFVLGSFCAGLLAPQLNAALLRGLIGAFLCFVAVVMLTNWKPSPHRTFPGPVGGSVIGYFGGLMSGIAGIAGGNVIVPTLIYFNTPAHNATATSSALGVLIAAAGALSYGFFQDVSASVTEFGYVDPVSFGIITIAAVITAPLGVKVAHRVPAPRLKQLFGALLIVVAGRMLYTATMLGS
ncbi:MAG: sulfite exporter TauE/SafE family protein [Pseudomonadota bacterium]